jgi:hypothetical protein
MPSDTHDQQGTTLQMMARRLTSNVRVWEQESGGVGPLQVLFLSKIGL